MLSILHYLFPAGSNKCQSNFRIFENLISAELEASEGTFIIFSEF